MGDFKIDFPFHIYFTVAGPEIKRIDYTCRGIGIQETAVRQTQAGTFPVRYNQLVITGTEVIGTVDYGILVLLYGDMAR